VSAHNDLLTSDDPRVLACVQHGWRAYRYQSAWNTDRVSWRCVWCHGVACGDWRETDPCMEPYHHEGDHRALSGVSWPLGGNRPKAGFRG